MIKARVNEDQWVVITGESVVAAYNTRTGVIFARDPKDIPNGFEGYQHKIDPMFKFVIAYEK